MTKFIKYSFIIIFFTILQPSIIVIFFKKIFLKKNNDFTKKNNIEIKDFVTNGAATFMPSKIDINEINKCNKTIKNLFFLNRYIFRNSLFNDKKVYLFSNINLKFLFPSVETILRKNLNSLFTNILGNNYKIISFLWQRNLHNPEVAKGETYSNYWHYDFKRQKKRWIRIMIYLNDQASVESIHWFDLNTSKKAIKEGLYGRYPSDKLPKSIDESKQNSSPGNLGTIKIINTADLLHRAGNLKKNKKRDVFFIILQSDLNWPVKDLEFLHAPKEAMIN